MTTEDAMQATPESLEPLGAAEPIAADAEADTVKTTSTRKRPRIDMAVEPRERKRGKTMFGLVLNTLTKAKNEDKERNASDAAKKRQSIDQRLQDKLRKETDTVRRADETKRAKTTANRKEEELQLKDSVHKLRRTRLPLLANFLLTSDVVPSVDSDAPASTSPAPPRGRGHTPLYYLPAKLLPSQEAFLQKRKTEVQEAAEKEWSIFKAVRSAGIEEIKTLRERVAQEESLKKASQPNEEDEPQEDVQMGVEGKPSETAAGGDATMDVDDEKREDAKKEEKPGEKATSTPVYDDDAVEY